MLECKEKKFSGHAVQRLFERKLTKQAVTDVITTGEIIAEYPNDSPYPSYLILGFVSGRALHVVVAFDKQTRLCYIISAYEPNTKQWGKDFKTRKKS